MRDLGASTDAAVAIGERGQVVNHDPRVLGEASPERHFSLGRGEDGPAGIEPATVGIWHRATPRLTSKACVTHDVPG